MSRGLGDVYKRQISNYNDSVQVLKNYNYNFENYLIEKDEHTMSQETITLFQNFIKKNI